MSHSTRCLSLIEGEHERNLFEVAFATSDRLVVDQHFGSARSLAIYGVGREQQHLRSVIEFTDLRQDGHEEKLTGRLRSLQGCLAVYCCACGGSAVRQLLALGVQPVTVREGVRIADLMQSLQQELRAGPSSWLVRAIRRRQPLRGGERFDVMEAEGWQD